MKTKISKSNNPAVIMLRSFTVSILYMERLAIFLELASKMGII